MKKIIILLACMLCLAGCTESNIVNAKEETIPVSAPDMELRDDIEIDWPQVSDDTEWLFNNTERFPYSRDYRFYLEPKKKEIMLMWVVDDELPDDEIRYYADTLIKEFNNMVAIQDFSIETAGADSYGGLWDEYALSFGIAPESTQDDESTWFISGSFDAGVDFVLPDLDKLTGDAEEEEAVEEESEASEEGSEEESVKYEIEMPEAQGPGAEATEASNVSPEDEEEQ